MKLKQRSDDFTVEEIPSGEFSQEPQAHQVFLLEKKEVDTFEAVRQLSRRFQVPLFEVGYAGLKDKHAVARQYVSFPSHFHVQPFSSENLRLSFVGYLGKKIKIGDLAGNRFMITVRDIKEDEQEDIKNRAKTIPLYGVPNYFDAQRFGSVFKGEFIGKFLIQRRYEEAVKQYLTAYLKSEPKQVKDEKRRILDQWDTLENVTVRTKQLAAVLRAYQATRDWCAAYAKVPAHLREMHVNAYQSFLWNECAREILNIYVKKNRLYSIEYPVGSLLFYTTLDEEERQKIPEMFPTIGAEMVLSELEQQVVGHVLARERVKRSDFILSEETGNFFKPRRRRVLVIPEGFAISDFQGDEMNSTSRNQRYKVQVSFSLSKGSYATVVTKRLFNH